MDAATSLETHPHAAEPVANVGIGPEDPSDVVVGFHRGGDRAQLHTPVGGDRGDARGQAACQCRQHRLRRRGPVVLRREDLRVVTLERERRAVGLLGAQPEEVLNGGATVRAVDPLDRRGTSTNDYLARTASLPRNHDAPP